MATRFPSKSKQPKAKAANNPARPTAGDPIEEARKVTARVAPVGGGPTARNTKMPIQTPKGGGDPRGLLGGGVNRGGNLPHSRAEMMQLRRPMDVAAQRAPTGMAPSRADQDAASAFFAARQQNRIAARQNMMRDIARQEMKAAAPKRLPAGVAPPVAGAPGAAVPAAVDPAAAAATAGPGADPAIQQAIAAAQANRARMAMDRTGMFRKNLAGGTYPRYQRPVPTPGAAMVQPAGPVVAAPTVGAVPAAAPAAVPNPATGTIAQALGGALV